MPNMDVYSISRFPALLGCSVSSAPVRGPALWLWLMSPVRRRVVRRHTGEQQAVTYDGGRLPHCARVAARFRRGCGAQRRRPYTLAFRGLLTARYDIGRDQYRSEEGCPVAVPALARCGR